MAILYSVGQSELVSRVRENVKIKMGKEDEKKRQRREMKGGGRWDRKMGMKKEKEIRKRKGGKRWVILTRQRNWFYIEETCSFVWKQSWDRHQGVWTNQGFPF